MNALELLPPSACAESRSWVSAQLKADPSLGLVQR